MTFENCVNYAHSKGALNVLQKQSEFENCVNYAHSKGCTCIECSEHVFENCVNYAHSKGLYLAHIPFRSLRTV